jgi:hypothetical protein
MIYEGIMIRRYDPRCDRPAERRGTADAPPPGECAADGRVRDSPDRPDAVSGQRTGWPASAWVPERDGPEDWHQLHEQRICRHTRLPGSSRQRAGTRLQMRQV